MGSWGAGVLGVCFTTMLGSWGAGACITSMLENWGAGVLGTCFTKMLGSWGAGMLGCWTVRIL